MASPATTPTHLSTQYASPPLQQTQPVPPDYPGTPYLGDTVVLRPQPAARPAARPIPSRYQGMSFSASTTSPQAQTIAYTFRNMKPEELHAKLLSAVEPKSNSGSVFGDDVLHPTWAIDDLFSSLKSLGIVGTVSEAAVSDPTLRHCVRCHDVYHERDNGLQMCKIEHDKGVLVNINEQPGSLRESKKRSRRANKRAQEKNGQKVAPITLPLDEKPVGLPPPQVAHIPSPYPSLSILEGAAHFQMRDVVVTVCAPPELTPAEGWKALIDYISPNALHNSDARYDAPKCDEDTRVELLNELMERIGDRSDPQCLVCMTGAAGAGKSSLQQTVAERCAESGILGSAYFFSNSDPTRNGTSTIVPTMAYQLGSHNADLRLAIGAAIAQDVVIFKRSVRTQMLNLLVGPLKSLRERCLASLPHAILIDGLDECKGEDRQAELLTVIRECLLAKNLPFRVFISSRPEWAMRTALQFGGHLYSAAYHIQLSDKYDASGDMYRYLERRFKQLILQTGDPNWFSKSDVTNLVKAGSGQFIYVATVHRYISERRASPVERLKTVLNWTPHQKGQVARPFEILDKLYTNILLRAKEEYDAIDTHSGRDFLLLLNIHHANNMKLLTLPLSQDYLAKLLHLEPGSTKILFSDLHSLVTINAEAGDSKSYLQISHKSFSDFLGAESRSKYLFVPLAGVHAHLVKCCFLHITQSTDFLLNAIQQLPLVWKQDCASLLDDEIIDFTRKGGWNTINSIPFAFKFHYSRLLDIFGPLTWSLRKRDPKVVGIMRAFFEEWKRQSAEYNLRRQERVYEWSHSRPHIEERRKARRSGWAI
ncbi:hypothetical protein MD484_g4767, partial [Candolleomyces efflorescens]